MAPRVAPAPTATTRVWRVSPQAICITSWSICNIMLELSNAQIAQVLSYSRGAWGNQAAPISELQVQAVRDPRQHR